MCIFLVVADAKKCLVCLLLVLFILCFEVLVVLFFDLPFHCFSVAGVVSKVVNHVNEFASTDALCLWDDLLLSSSFDLDHGSGYINGELAFQKEREQTDCVSASNAVLCECQQCCTV